jgi:hypothetical protein
MTLMVAVIPRHSTHSIRMCPIDLLVGTNCWIIDGELPVAPVSTQQDPPLSCCKLRTCFDNTTSSDRQRSIFLVERHTVSSTLTHFVCFLSSSTRQTTKFLKTGHYASSHIIFGSFNAKQNTFKREEIIIYTRKWEGNKFQSILKKHCERAQTGLNCHMIRSWNGVLWIL